MSSVDVVVPCFRYGRFLRECVGSVLTQSGPELRVLIIDDASPDNTAEVAEELVCSDPASAIAGTPRIKG
ncbi:MULTISPECIES: glycosyltransferase [unclassified Bradyrhizobium]|uniref:glycosyltransferase family 2 protein n=1 Tax=unclassified Bradyrhizobium TaxID=2631580 RepID=UPI0020979726|nr:MULTISPECIES: glycosyltransferase [unclassified Bradyrhizobium]